MTGMEDNHKTRGVIIRIKESCEGRNEGQMAPWFSPGPDD